jgi:hypothetical protein
VTNSDDQKTFQQYPDRKNIKKGNLKRPVNPPRRPNPKPLVGGMEYISTTKLKSYLRPPSSRK